jgi:hypothetical protein
MVTKPSSIAPYTDTPRGVCRTRKGEATVRGDGARRGHTPAAWRRKDDFYIQRGLVMLTLTLLIRAGLSWCAQSAGGLP